MFGQQRFDDARRLLEGLMRSIHANRHFPQAALLRGASLEKLGQTRTAIKGYLALQRSLQSDKTPAGRKDLAEVWYRLGKLYTSTAKHRQALHAYQQAAALPQPRRAASQAMKRSAFLAAGSLARLGKVQQAIQQYQQALRQYPQHAQAPWAQYYIGVQYMRLGAFEEARTQFQLVARRPGSPAALWRTLALEKEKNLAKHTTGG